MSDESIFAAALGKAPGAERRAFLDEACGGRRGPPPAHRAAARGRRPDRRHPRARPRRRHRPAERWRTARRPRRPYKLLQQIGEGGMGVVYMAEQTSRSAASVALKIIKPGMDSRQVIARFEAERQALAMMDHQNIARVLDAGDDRKRPALLRDGAGPRRADHPVLRRATSSPRASGWSCSSRFARRSSTRIRRGSSTATSSRPTSW